MLIRIIRPDQTIAFVRSENIKSIYLGDPKSDPPKQANLLMTDGGVAEITTDSANQVANAIIAQEVRSSTPTFTVQSNTANR